MAKTPSASGIAKGSGTRSIYCPPWNLGLHQFGTLIFNGVPVLPATRPSGPPRPSVRRCLGLTDSPERRNAEPAVPTLERQQHLSRFRGTRCRIIANCIVPNTYSAAWRSRAATIGKTTAGDVSGIACFGRLTRAQSGTKWNKVPHSATQWHKVEQSGIKWNKVEQTKGQKVD